MAFATKYLFKFNSIHGVEHQIHIQKDGYSGAVIQRPLGRSPKLMKRKNGPVCGTSLELYAECQVDGEFAEMYTSNPKEWKVLLYRGASLVWQGFVSPELYSEPSIAPPYDVQIVATDGLGELKLYRYPAQGLKALKTILSDLLSVTGLSLNLHIISSLAVAQSSALNFFRRRINLDFMEDETYYDVLTRLLDSLHMTITLYKNQWYLVRETDVVISSAGNVDEIAITPGGTESEIWETLRITAGQMGVANMWPIGNLSTKIEPAKRSIKLQMPWHITNLFSNPNMETDSDWTKNSTTKVRYNYQGHGGYALGKINALDSSAYIWGEISQPISVKKLTNALTVSARIYSSIGGTLTSPHPRVACYAIFTPTDSSNPTKYWYGGYWKDSAPSSYDQLEPQSPTDNGNFEDGCVEAASTYEWSIQGLGANYPGILRIIFGGDYVRVYAAALTVELFNKGYEDIININNGARGDGETLELIGGRVTEDVINIGALQGIWVSNSANNAETSFTDSHWTTGRDFLSLTALGHAMSIADERIRTEGKLDIPSGMTYLPFVLKTTIDHLVETYEWDIAADEFSFSALTLPAVALTVESEVVRELTGGTSGGTSSGSGSSGGGGGTGGTTMAEVQQWVTAQGYLTGITYAQVVAALGYVPAESQYDAQMYALAAPPTLIRRKGWDGHSVDGELTDTLQVQHRLIGISGCEVVLMTYRKRNGRSHLMSSHKVWKNKKGWCVAAGDYDVCGYVPFTSASGILSVQTLRTFILKRFVTFSGLTPAQVFANMTAQLLASTYYATNKGFKGNKARMRFGIAIRVENPEFNNAAGDQVKDTCMEVYSASTHKYEPRYYYSSVAPLTAFLRTEGQNAYRNRLDFSLLGDSANVMMTIENGGLDYVVNNDPSSLFD